MLSADTQLQRPESVRTTYSNVAIMARIRGGGARSDLELEDWDENGGTVELAVCRLGGFMGTAF